MWLMTFITCHSLFSLCPLHIFSAERLKWKDISSLILAITSRPWQHNVPAVRSPQGCISEEWAAELQSHISSLKKEWVALFKMEFSLILILHSSAAAAAAFRVSKQNQHISFPPSPVCLSHLQATLKCRVARKEQSQLIDWSYTVQRWVIAAHLWRTKPDKISNRLNGL